jgi:hypothetical protein
MVATVQVDTIWKGPDLPEEVVVLGGPEAPSPSRTTPAP